MRLCVFAISLFFWHFAATQSLEQLDAWDKEVIPAMEDPEIARQVEIFSTPEDWDHP